MPKSLARQAFDLVESRATKPFTIPADLGAAADLIYALQEQRSALNKYVEVIEKEVSALKNHFIENLPKSQANGTIGKFAKVELKTKVIPTVKDWALFWGFAKKDKDGIRFFQKRVNAEPIQEQWDAKKKVPGVETFNAISVSITKR